MLETLPFKVSIITVCYNSESTIENTIKSVISQDYPHIEHIMVDGGSKDKTLGIIDIYKKNISAIISEPDNGIYDAMNKGIKMANGEIIGILNSDDIFYSNSILSEIVRVFEQKNHIDAVYGNIIYFKDNDTSRTVRKWVTKEYYPSFFDNGEIAPHPSLFVKKKVYDEIGTYYPNFKISSDYEFMLRAFKKNGYTPLHLNHFIVKMRMGGESTKGFRNTLIANKEVVKAWRMNGLRPPLQFWFLRFFKKVFQYYKI